MSFGWKMRGYPSSCFMVKQLFYGELMTGKRPQHKPKKRFKDCIKNNLKAFKIPVENWET